MGLAVLAVSWGSSFFFIAIALRHFGPLTVAAGRIFIGALFLLSIAFVRRERFPRLTRRNWGLLVLAALVETALPFMLISWGQTHIASSEAAILMAFTPLAVLGFAHVMTNDEKITKRKLIGLVMGFMGVVVLMGGVSGDMTHDGVLGKLAVLTGAIGYGLGSLLFRKLSRMPALVAAAGVMAISSLVVVPLALIFENPFAASPDWQSLAALTWLGLVPSAITVLILIWLLARVGATLVSLNNYIVPVTGSILGVAFLNESFSWSSFFGLVLILTGILIAQRVRWRRHRRVS